jgi:hypothetical protein
MELTAWWVLLVLERGEIVVPIDASTSEGFG